MTFAPFQCDSSPSTEYATKQWVENKRYSTEEWVEEQEYASKEWTQNQGYLTEHQDISMKLDKPTVGGVTGQVLTANGDGTTRWDDVSDGGAFFIINVEFDDDDNLIVGKTYEEVKTAYLSGLMPIAIITDQYVLQLCNKWSEPYSLSFEFRAVTYLSTNDEEMPNTYNSVSLDSMDVYELRMVSNGTNFYTEYSREF